MNRRLTISKSCISFLVFILSFISSNAQTLAFPGAEGHGAYTTGGRGGTVIEVTNLNDDGAGSLRAAIKASGTRTVVFKVSGTIELQSRLQISNGNITIAGQTAPGDGICLANYALNINASNVIIRFIRSRMGDVYLPEDDAMNGRNKSNIIIDHCTMSWSVDEAASFYDNENFTLQWCIISESLYASGHSKGNHGYGGIWGGWGASFHHNLLAHHTSRNPRFCGARYHIDTAEKEVVDFRNNVIYNWGFNSAYGGEYGQHNMVNNYFKYGPATGTGGVRYRIINPSDASTQSVISKWYVNGNYVKGYSNVTSDNWNGGVQPSANDITLATFKATEPFATGPILTHSATDAFDAVLAYAGACYPSRDATDTRIVGEAQNGTATYGGAYGTSKGIIDNQTTVGGWATLNTTTAPTDTDSDGIPDEWETANGLNSADASDRNNTNEDGYTMLELYLNSLVADIMTAESQKAVASGESQTSTATAATIAQSTCTDASGTASPWNFLGGYTVSNENSKTFATGSEDGIKFSSGVQFTVNLPENIQISSVKFTGYDNYAGVDAYLSELNGSTFLETDYVFPQKDASGNYTVASKSVDFASPVSGSFTFTFEGKQVVIAMELTISASTSVQIPTKIAESPYDIVNVYTIDGRMIRNNVFRTDALENLPNGIYIVDGKKIAIFK